MDNASFHFFTPEVKKAISDAGVIIEYQPPYSPDLNPIEYLFGSIKNRIRERSLADGDLIQGDLKSYLLMQVRIMSMDKRVSRGHFRKAQIEIQEDSE
jgi:transposase